MKEFFDSEEEDEKYEFEILLLDLEDLDDLVKENNCDCDEVEDQSLFDVVLSDDDWVALKSAIVVVACVEVDEDGSQEDGNDRKVDGLEEGLILVAVIIWVW